METKPTLETILERLNAVEANVLGRVDALTAQVNVLTAQVNVLTEQVNGLKERVNQLTLRVDNLELRVGRLEEQVAAGFEAVRGELKLMNRRLMILAKTSLDHEARLGELEELAEAVSSASNGKKGETM